MGKEKKQEESGKEKKGNSFGGCGSHPSWMLQKGDPRMDGGHGGDNPADIKADPTDGKGRSCWLSHTLGAAGWQHQGQGCSQPLWEHVSCPCCAPRPLQSCHRPSSHHQEGIPAGWVLLGAWMSWSPSEPC